MCRPENTFLAPNAEKVDECYVYTLFRECVCVYVCVGRQKLLELFQQQTRRQTHIATGYVRLIGPVVECDFGAKKETPSIIHVSAVVRNIL